ncbi:unnamed protein product [Linum trigynum]|uniref:Uncharacterized protein n=1 Tax=Linum trigynum TaxID=586398 RepID=A0AAV2FEJ3_9ROSI
MRAGTSPLMSKAVIAPLSTSAIRATPPFTAAVRCSEARIEVFLHDPTPQAAPRQLSTPSPRSFKAVNSLPSTDAVIGPW